MIAIKLLLAIPQNAENMLTSKPSSTCAVGVGVGGRVKLSFLYTFTVGTTKFEASFCDQTRNRGGYCVITGEVDYEVEEPPISFP